VKLRRVFPLVIGFVFVPAALMLAVGILILVYGSVARDYLFGGLIVALVVTTVAGTAATMAVLNREARVAKLQTDFVNKVSHDLRTPLTSIMGYVELALDDTGEPKLDDERRGFLEVVSRSSYRLMRLVDDLLFVARLQAGRLDLTPSLLDLAALARQAAEEARRQASAKGVELVFEGDESVEIDADKGRMFQLLDNLVSNAIKFTPEGGRVEVCVALNGGAVLEVRDTGIGLTQEEAARVFERFFRTENAVQDQVPGTGLGLFIAQAIAEAHGGRISAQPREGGGAVFRVVLPQRHRG
jgi:two-component system phosphate regulon sensor histidine kinase PhoR